MDGNHAEDDLSLQQRYNRLDADHREVLAANDRLLTESTTARKEVIHLQEANLRLSLERMELKRKLLDLEGGKRSSLSNQACLVVPDLASKSLISNYS